MIKITCENINKTFYSELNTNLYQELKQNEIPIASSCGGEGVCKKCIVFLNETEGLPPLTELEIRAKLNQGERLACQLHLNCSLTISTTYW